MKEKDLSARLVKTQSAPSEVMPKPAPAAPAPVQAEQPKPPKKEHEEPPKA